MNWRTASGRWSDPRASVRVLLAAALGLVAGLVVSIFTFWQAATLIGWDLFSFIFITWIWWNLKDLGPEGCREHANREDPSRRLTELIVLFAGVAVLAAVGLALVRAGNSSGGTKAYLIALGVLSVAVSWALLHTVFTLRYARSYYSQPVGGVDFNEEDPPSYLDFAYLAVTIGMTFQVSDTNLTSKGIRRDRAVACPSLVPVRSHHCWPRHQRGLHAPPLSSRPATADHGCCHRCILGWLTFCSEGSVRTAYVVH